MQAEEACAEMLRMLSDFLPKEHPDYFQKQGNTLTALKTDETFQIQGASMHPLEACARIVQACLRQHSHLRQHERIGHQDLAKHGVFASALKSSNLLRHAPNCCITTCAYACQDLACAHASNWTHGITNKWEICLCDSFGTRAQRCAVPLCTS